MGMMIIDNYVTQNIQLTFVMILLNNKISSVLVVLKFTGLKCPNFSSSHLLSRDRKMVENIFRQKQWKIFSTKIAGNYFPVEKVFHRADEFSLRVQ